MEGSLFQKIHACLQPGSQEAPHSGSPLFDDQLARRLAHIAGRATPQSDLRNRPPSVNSHGMSIDDEGSIADSGHQSMLHSYASRNHSYSLSADLMRLQQIVKDLKEQQDNFGKYCHMQFSGLPLMRFVFSSALVCSSTVKTSLLTENYVTD